MLQGSIEMQTSQSSASITEGQEALDYFVCFGMRTGRVFREKGGLQLGKTHFGQAAVQCLPEKIRVAISNLSERSKYQLMIREHESVWGERCDCTVTKLLLVKMLTECTQHHALQGLAVAWRARVLAGKHIEILSATGHLSKASKGLQLHTAFWRVRFTLSAEIVLAS